MTTFGDLGLGGGFQRVGRGFQVRELPPAVERWFRSFRRGYVAVDSAADTPDDSSPYALDLQVDRRDRIARPQGVETIETLAYDPVAVFTHAGLDGQTEIVMIAPPYIGVRDPFVGTTAWYSVGLPASQRWVAVNHGGVLVFSDGESNTYARQIGSTTVETLGWGPVKTLASFAARVIAGNADIGAVHNVMGYKWTGASGEYDDLAGLGSGFELLLSDMAQGDEIVALRTSGFDTLIFLLRKSVWVGRRTGDPFRPIDVVPAIPGLGCVSERCAVNALGGVAWLSDTGVELYDGSMYKHLSSQIDADLLPMNLVDIDLLHMVYSHLDKSLLLFVGDESWSYSFEFDRWRRSTLRADNVVSFFNPAGVDVSELSAGWDDYWSGYWSDAPEGVTILAGGDLIYFLGARLGMQEPESIRYWDSPQQTYWRLPEQGQKEFDRLVELREIEVVYLGAGTVEFELLLPDGTLGAPVQAVLEESGSRERRKRFKLFREVLDLTGALRIVEGSPRIAGIRLAGRLGRELSP